MTFVFAILALTDSVKQPHLSKVQVMLPRLDKVISWATLGPRFSVPWETNFQTIKIFKNVIIW